MARTTQKELHDLLRIINSQGIGEYTLEWAYGQPRLYRDGGSREVSPRLPTGQMAEWMRAFLAGTGARRRSKGNPRRNPLLAEVLANPRTVDGIRRPYGVYRAPSGRILVGDAVYEIRYRHAEDGDDYVHTFEEPENVRIEVIDRRTVVIRGVEHPIIGDV